MITEISYEIVIHNSSGKVDDVLDGEFSNPQTCVAIIKDRYSSPDYVESGYIVGIREITRTVI